MEADTPDIIIIKGAPGSGKSQTAKSLASFFPAGVRVEIDTVRQMVISVDWKNQQEHIEMLDLSVGMVNDFLRRGYKPVIVVDTFSGNKIKKYVETLAVSDNERNIKVFSLYVSEEELKTRIASRTDEEFTDLAVCLKLNADTIKYKQENDLIIDTTGLKSHQSAQLIFQKAREIGVPQ